MQDKSYSKKMLPPMATKHVTDFEVVIDTFTFLSIFKSKPSLPG